MSSFSERYGYKSIKNIIQAESMDDDLRISLWNALSMSYWNEAVSGHLLSAKSNRSILWLLENIWSGYLKRPVDEIGDFWSPAHKFLKQYFNICKWYEAYDFIEFVSKNYYDDSTNNQFRQNCNKVLECEVSRYRFVGETIAPIISKEEINEVEEALSYGDELLPVSTHLKTALSLLSDRKSPDYRNSIKESISAVEAICRLIAGSNATLGKALGEIQRQGKIDLPVNLRNAFDQLYTYTSSEGGIRHSLLEKTDLDFEDAMFMMVSCSAFTNYLKVKTSKAGIDLESH